MKPYAISVVDPNLACGSIIFKPGVQTTLSFKKVPRRGYEPIFFLSKTRKQFRIASDTLLLRGLHLCVVPHSNINAYLKKKRNSSVRISLDWHNLENPPEAEFEFVVGDDDYTGSVCVPLAQLTDFIVPIYSFAGVEKKESAVYKADRLNTLAHQIYKSEKERMTWVSMVLSLDAL